MNDLFPKENFLIHNISSAAQCCLGGNAQDIGLIDNAAIVVEKKKIAWIGMQKELPPHYKSLLQWDACGLLAIPALIDCHTHLGFGGWRDDEFVLRCSGVNYLEIAKNGGGIGSSVRKTRSASEMDLLADAQAMLDNMRKLGIGIIEAKSGYGLSFEDECKQLRVLKKLPGVISTCLAAHTVPFDFERADYIGMLKEKLLPYVAEHKLASFCDIFIEETAFSLTEAKEIFACAQMLGFGIKVHADQLKNHEAALLGAQYSAISADHLEYVSDAGIAAMKKSGTVAVSLPLASLYLKERYMPARKCIDAGICVAVATDFNPGTAPSYHIYLAMTLACIYQAMHPHEALKGATIYAAKALGLEKERGSLEVGKWADIAFVDAPSVQHLMYHFKPNPCVCALYSFVDA